MSILEPTTYLDGHIKKFTLHKSLISADGLPTDMMELKPEVRIL